MDFGWLASLALVFGLEKRKQEKEGQAQQESLSEHRKELSEAIGKLHETIELLLLKCGPIILNADFAAQTKLASLYAIGEVLFVQGNISQEQETVLKIILSNLNPPYNYSEFTNAVINRSGVYEEYWNIVGFGDKTCGSLWRSVFELIYCSRQLEALQEIINQLTLIVIRFSFLEGSNASYAKPICDRILSCMNKHINDYQHTPYIHAIILLQQALLQQFGFVIEDHFLVRGIDMIFAEHNYYVFDIFDKVTQASCGRFAVKELHAVDDKVNYSDEVDVILKWNAEKLEYYIIFEE